MACGRTRSTRAASAVGRPAATSAPGTTWAGPSCWVSRILIIADIIQTITIDATIESAATLALIVLVRTFLSFSLDIELEGMAPWRRAEVELAHPGTNAEDL